MSITPWQRTGFLAFVGSFDGNVVMQYFVWFCNYAHVRSHMRVFCWGLKTIIAEGCQMAYASIVTRQTACFVCCCDSLAELLPEMHFRFTQKGLQVQQVTGTDAILVSLVLPSDNFDEYEVRTPVEVHVSTTVLCGVLKTANITDTLTLTYDSKPNPYKLCVTLRNALGPVRTFYIPACHVDCGAGQELMPQAYDVVLHMATKQLVHLIQNVFGFSDTVKMSIEPANGVTFSFESQNCFVQRGKVRLGSKQGRSDSNAATTGSTNVEVTFQSSKLALFQRCLALHSVCNMYIAQNSPLVLEIVLNELGHLRLCLLHVEAD